MPKLPEELLRHILEECKYILSVIDKLNDYDDLQNNEDLKRSLTRSIEIIGEASKNVPVDIKLKWKEINWKDINAMRNRLVHEYFGVNYLIVWDVIKNKIPDLKNQIENILKEY
ncbi:MAG: HepT-like ribonuclease domain-containing protein [Bacteroidia bacterium]